MIRNGTMTVTILYKFIVSIKRLTRENNNGYSLRGTNNIGDPESPLLFLRALVFYQKYGYYHRIVNIICNYK